MLAAPLLIHQAYFGAVRGTSHGELATSLPNADLRAFLVGFTDRPGTLPPGVALPPYLSAGTHGGYLLVSRTWADTYVARPGMVFTHVLLVPLAAASQLTELADLLRLLTAHLPPVAARLVALAPLLLTMAEPPPAAPTASVPATWLAALRHLAEPPPTPTTFVVGEAASFERLLIALWHGLPAALRPHLNWGSRFAPPAGHEEVPRLVSVAPALAGQWRGQRVLTLDEAEQQVPGTVLEQLVFGGAEQAGFRQLLAQLELPVTSFHDLRRYQQVYELTKKLTRATASGEEALVLARALNALQPDPAKAVELKDRVVEAVARGLANDAGERALALRNLPMAAFRTGATRLGPAVAGSVRQLVAAVPPQLAAQGALLDQLAEADPARRQPWWQDAAELAFTGALASGTAAGAGMAWVGLTRTEATRAYILQALPNNAAWEALLIPHVPAIMPSALAKPLVAGSTGRSWWELTANVLAAAYAPAEALTRQMQAEQPLALRESPRLRWLAAQVPDEALLAIALREPSRQLQELAGERCGHSPALLAGLDIQSPAWLLIWVIALRRTQSLTAGLADPAVTITELLTRVAAGKLQPAEPEALELLERVAASPYADVLGLPTRPRLWERLPTPLRPRFLQATLDALVAAVLAGQWTGTVEPALRTAGQEKEFTTRLLRLYRAEATAVLAMDAVLGNLRDEYLRDYLLYLPMVSGPEASQLGQLVAARRWSLAAGALLERAQKEEAFRPALRECAGLFSWWDKLRYATLFQHQVTSQEAWTALEELLKQLYPAGPERSGIWLRAGGDPAELPVAPTPAAQWAVSLRLLRQGGGGRITAYSLLQAVRQQFANNSSVQAMMGNIHLLARA